MRCGLAMSATGQTGQSEAIHSPEACASMVVRLITPALAVERRGLQGRDLMLAERLAHDVEAAGERCIAEAALPLPWPSAPDCGGQRLFRIDQFGLRLGQG